MYGCYLITLFFPPETETFYVINFLVSFFLLWFNCRIMFVSILIAILSFFFLIIIYVLLFFVVVLDVQ